MSAQSYGAVDEETMRSTLEAALEVGVTTLDCSAAWGDARGERAIGEVLKSSDTEVQLIARVESENSDDEAFSLEAFQGQCRTQVEGSLERLGVSKIDLVLLNHPDSALMDMPDWHMGLRALVEEGLVGAWGVSTSRGSTARLALTAGPDALCLPYNLLHSRLLEEVSGEIMDAGCGVIARTPLNYGMLGGHWAKFQGFDEGDHRRERWSRPVFEKRLTQMDLLRFLLHGDVREMASAALRFVLSHPAVVTTTLGARNPGQIKHASKLIGEAPYLDEEDMVRLQQILIATDD